MQDEDDEDALTTTEGGHQVARSGRRGGILFALREEAEAALGADGEREEVGKNDHSVHLPQRARIAAQYLLSEGDADVGMSAVTAAHGVGAGPASL